LKRRQGDEGKKEEVEEKTRDEGKTRRSREESPSPEDESDKTHHLELSIQLLNPSLSFSLKLFC
jgi:hypothetical protein